MPVELTSEVYGQAVGTTYTGPEEAWLLAQGYAKQASYTGPGVANTGAADTTPANDPRRAANREAPYFPGTPDRHTTVANDAANLNDESLAAPDYDFDSGADAEAATDLTVDPRELPLAGGEVTVYGNNLEGVSAATVGGTAVTNLDVTNAGDGVITFTAPAKAAGAHAVSLTDTTGAVAAGNITYA